MVVERNFVGKGWLFPIRFDPVSGGVARDRGQGIEQQRRRVRQAIYLRIQVQRGEMYFARRFGSRLRRLLWALNTQDIRQRLSFEARAALEDPEYGEKRALVERIEVIPPDRVNNKPTAEIRVDFVLRGTQDQGSLVFPYYLNNSERAAAESQFDE